MKNKFLIALAVFGIVFVLGMTKTLGAELTLQNSPPCLLQGEGEFGPCDDPANTFASYIRRIYQFGLGIAGVLAVGMIIAGAIRRVVSAGNPSNISEANSMITSALWGIALLFGSYLILKTVNPQLVILKDPAAPTVTSTNPFAYQNSTSTLDCPVPGQTACFFDPEKLEENPGNPTLASLDFEDGSATGRAIDNVTAACNGTQPKPTFCKCENCRPLVPASSFPSKVSACGKDIRGQGGLGQCFLERRTRTGFERIVSRLNGTGIVFSPDNGGWRMSEAWPPTSPHQSICHYIGTCFDLGSDRFLTSSSSLLQNPSREICEEIKTVARVAKDYFGKVLIEAKLVTAPGGNMVSQLNYCIVNNILSSSEVTSARYTGGIHLHISDPK